MDNTVLPKWQRELISFKGIKSTFIIEGNISDEYPFYTNEKDVAFFSLNKVITNIFDSDVTENIYETTYCDFIFGVTKDSFSDSEIRRKKTQNLNMFVENSEQIRQSMSVRNGDKSTLNIINFSSRYLNSPDSMEQNEIAFFQNLFYASINALTIGSFINTLILIVNKFNDIPAWFFINNPNVRTITIPNPDRNIRKEYIETNYTVFNEHKTSETEKIQNRFIDLTDGMKLLELKELHMLYKKSNKTIEEIPDIVTMYKYGFSENKWTQIRETLGNDMKEQIRKRVKGQDHIIDEIVKIIKRSVVGLSGMQHSSGSKPRGILFLAGPTGTGKTETVKAVTELLFKDEKSLIRFDMSEYAAEHSDQKLFGAPPGYVGYDSGGQLTNAVKNNPFSVLLFDEIEKAHPKIMDKFLQILEDGRMTDGQGNTIYFTETLIFFTSNIGISEETIHPFTGAIIERKTNISPDEPYDQIRNKIIDAMKMRYKPEVINRFGENILVFNYIDEISSKEIAKSQIDNINLNYQKNNKIAIKLHENAYELLYSLCWEDEPRSNGGRGIGNVIEAHYLNQLAEFIFDNNCKENEIINVTAENKHFAFMNE